jgi:hypothetical protein
MIASSCLVIEAEEKQEPGRLRLGSPTITVASRASPSAPSTTAPSAVQASRTETLRRVNNRTRRLSSCYSRCRHLRLNATARRSRAARTPAPEATKCISSATSHRPLRPANPEGAATSLQTASASGCATPADTVVFLCPFVEPKPSPSPPHSALAERRKTYTVQTSEVRTASSRLS